MVLSHTKMLIQSTKHKQTVHTKLTTERLTQKGPCPERWVLKRKNACTQKGTKSPDKRDTKRSFKKMHTHAKNEYIKNVVNVLVKNYIRTMPICMKGK